MKDKIILELKNKSHKNATRILMYSTFVLPASLFFLLFSYPYHLYPYHHTAYQEKLFIKFDWSNCCNKTMK